MMGGKNSARMIGDKTEFVYYIEVDKSICCIDIEYPAKIYKIITLEEFLEKYPFKVGDLVQHNGATSCGSVYEVEKMQWDYKNNKVKYIVKRLGLGDSRKFTIIEAEYLQPYEKEITKEKKINQMSIANCDLDEVEIVLGDKFELVNREGKYYAVKKQPKYPKTYEHCCKIEGGITPSRHLQYDTTPWYQFEEDLRDSLENLRKLIICRDAYWKIAGEQMGLGKPWEPDWENCNENKYCLYITRNNVNKGTFVATIVFLLSQPQKCEMLSMRILMTTLNYVKNYCSMKIRIELEVEITGNCSFSEAKDFFRYEFAGYSLSNWENNPLVNEDSDTEYKVTDIEIEEL